MIRFPASTPARCTPQAASVAAAPGAFPRRLRQLGLLLLLLCGWLLAAPAMASTCGPATSQGATGPIDYSTYCWLDFSGYNDTTARSSAGQNFVFNLPGGAT